MEKREKPFQRWTMIFMSLKRVLLIRQMVIKLNYDNIPVRGRERKSGIVRQFSSAVI